MSTFYKIGGWGEYVTKVEVERFTEHTLWIKGRQHRRMSQWHRYFELEFDAWDHLISRAGGRIESCKDDLAYQEKELTHLLVAYEKAKG